MSDHVNKHRGSDDKPLDKQRETTALMGVLGVDLAHEPAERSQFQRVLDLEKDRVEGLITDAECSEAVQNVVAGTLGTLPLK